ncbi:MAG: hypothetical protein ACRCZY_01015, partial [Phocaeicola sp.]
TFAHISTSMTNNETIGFIQIKHSFFEYKSRKEKREEKYGRIRMDTINLTLLLEPVGFNSVESIPTYFCCYFVG